MVQQDPTPPPESTDNFRLGYSRFTPNPLMWMTTENFTSKKQCGIPGTFGTFDYP